MLAIPLELIRRYESRLAQQNVMAGQRPHYHKWLRYYLDFCHKYGFTPTDRQSLPAFQEKLLAKHQPETLCQQAGHAVSLYWQMVSPSAAGSHAPHGFAAPLNTAENRNVSRTMVERAPSQFPAEKPSVGSSAPPSLPPEIVSPREKIVAPPSRSPVSSQPLPRPERAMIGGAQNPSSANSARALSQNNNTKSAEYQLTGASWVWVYDGLTSAIISPQLCQPSLASQLRHSHHSGIAGSQQCMHDHDLHPHGKKRHLERSKKPAGFMKRVPTPVLKTARYGFPDDRRCLPAFPPRQLSRPRPRLPVPDRQSNQRF